MTYAELAQALGLPSARAGEAKARRAKWGRHIGNDGLARVAVPLSALQDPKGPRRPHGSERRANEGPTEAEAFKIALAEVKAAHQAELSAERSSRQAAEAEAERLRGQLAVTAAELANARAAMVQVEAEKSHAQGEAAGLRMVLDELRRPFWMRWLGIR